MDVSHAMVLGIVQGLTEALPISSSAHLVIIPWFLKWPDQGLSFDIALHVGTALAFTLYFFKDWVNIIRSAFAPARSPQSHMLWWIMIATVPAMVAGLFLEKKAEVIFRSPLLIAWMLFVFAIILWWADRSGKKQRTLEQMDLKTALIMGFAQMLALMPGVSRSGITLTAGLFKGLSREAAARFSFLLASPIVIGAGILKLHKLHGADLNPAFLTGVGFSLLSGFLGIHFLLAFVRRSNFNIFVFYRIGLAALVAVMVILR